MGQQSEPQTSSDAERHRSKKLGEIWPGDADPSSKDAEVAYQIVDPETIDLLKNVVYSDSQAKHQVQYLNDKNLSVLVDSNSLPRRLPWPMLWISELSASSHVDQDTNLEELVGICQREFLQKEPFLKDIPAIAFVRQPRPQYLTLALATLGAMISGQLELKCIRLWKTAVMQVMLRLEVDSGEARNIDTIKTCLLLETYGLWSSNRTIWKQTWMAHPAAKTMVWRILSQSTSLRWPEGQSLNPCGAESLTDPSQSLTLYFIMIDVFRAIHYGQSVSFPAPEIVLRSAATSSPSAIDSDQQHTMEHPKRRFISLISLLSGVHTSTTLFSPFTAMVSADPWTDLRYPTGDGYIPFSSQQQKRGLTNERSETITSWKEKHLASAPKELALLYHFCVLLHKVEHIQSLFVLSGYSPRFAQEARMRQEERKVLKESSVYRTAVPVAWQVLEASELIDTEELPMWAALSVFSAGLVIWAGMNFPKSNIGPAPPARMLSPFLNELARMNLPCIVEMANTLTRLRQRVME